jgi:YihY family inner membrane protein
MNPIERGIRQVDKWQQRHRATAFGFAVFKKFGDDQGGNLVALITYFAFLSIFPLLLALTSILGLVLAGHPDWQRSIQTSALSEFPIIGDQLREQTSGAHLPHSGWALAVGLIGAILGGRGLANAVQNVMNTVWNVPKVDRPGFPNNQLRTFGILGLLFLGACLTAGASALAGAAGSLGIHGWPLTALLFALSTVIDIGLFWAAFRLATAKVIGTRDLLPGAILSGIAWQLLLALAGIIVNHYLRHAQAVGGLFGVVLGLLAWFGLQATVTVYAVEADVVRARRLWPRSVTQPPLTHADRKMLTDSAEAERRRPEQEVSVEFTPDADHDPLQQQPLKPDS